MLDRKLKEMQSIQRINNLVLDVKKIQEPYGDAIEGADLQLK